MIKYALVLSITLNLWYAFDADLMTMYASWKCSQVGQLQGGVGWHYETYLRIPSDVQFDCQAVK